MKRNIAVLFLLLIAVYPARTQQPPPPSHLHTEYLKDSKETRVDTNMLYVVNTPEQFLELQLRAWYPKQQLVQPAKHINLEMYSFSKAPLYAQEADWRITAVVDGEALELGRLDRLALKGQTQGGQEVFYASKQSAVGLQVPLPQRAQLRTTTPFDETTLEMLTLTLKPEHLARIAQAHQVEMRFGPTRYTFNDVHMSIMREFVAAITPAGTALASGGPPPPPAADTSNEFANAALPDVLKFLKKELGRNALATAHDQFEVVDLSSCQIRYRIAPNVSPAPPPGLGAIPSDPSYRFIPPTDDYYVNLADLSPDSVQVDGDDKSAYISFATLNGQQKIKHTRKDNSTGSVITSYGDVLEARGSFHLRATKTEPQIGHAPVRAIQLCQEAKP